MKKIALRDVMGKLSDGEGRKKYTFLEEGTPEHKVYLTMRESYSRVKSQIERGEVYDFYSIRKRFRRNVYPLSRFNRFKIVDVLKDSGTSYIFRDGGYEQMSGKASYKPCPFCNIRVQEGEMDEHLRRGMCGQRTEEENKVTVVFDKGIRTEYKTLVLDCKDVRELKKIVYDRTGVSVSKQDVYRGDGLLKNSDILGGETVTLRQKRREQKK